MTVLQEMEYTMIYYLVPFAVLYNVYLAHLLKVAYMVLDSINNILIGHSE